MAIMMKLPIISLTTLLGLVLLGCSQTAPLLEQHPAFIGTWQSDQNSLDIEKDGDVTFVQKQNTNSKTELGEIQSHSLSKMKAELSQLDSQHLVIGQGHFAQSFKIDRAPDQQAGKWQMVLDGIPYTRQE